MSKSYHEIMQKIEVTDDMRTRILKNIADADTKIALNCNVETDIKPASDNKLESGIESVSDDSQESSGNSKKDSKENNKKRKIRSFKRRYLSAAACLAVLILAAVVMPNVLKSQEADSSTPTVTAPSSDEVSNPMADIEEYTTAEELAAAAGFEVQDLSQIPFEVNRTTYSFCWGEMAEITYQGSDNTLTYRKSLGDGDNSGDYNDYTDVKEIETDSKTITLKGENGSYVLAIWSENGYAQSISLENGISQEEMLAMIPR